LHHCQVQCSAPDGLPRPPLGQQMDSILATKLWKSALFCHIWLKKQDNFHTFWGFRWYQKIHGFEALLTILMKRALFYLSTGTGTKCNNEGKGELDWAKKVGTKDSKEDIRRHWLFLISCLGLVGDQLLGSKRVYQQRSCYR
jgi:hypothetical protein